MNAALGQGGVLLGTLASVMGTITLVTGLATKRANVLRSARVYAFLVLIGGIVSVAAMQRALITRDFSLSFVAEHGSHSTQPLFTVATMWSALEGSILLWALVLAMYVAAVAIRFRSRATDPLVGWAMVTLFVVSAFFFGLMMGPANPFNTLSGVLPTDGPGPNPLLQNHVLMAIHPPLLYLGYVGFTVPFAFAIGSLVTARTGEGWLLETRRWTLFSWACLSAGIVLGAWWSYEVLGWGGYWAWDPVENASFLPWLTATAYLHSVVVQERRGMLRVWNLSLLLATFSLTILGTFLTRSGVLQSVHSFTESPLGPLLLGFFGFTVAVVVGLIGWRGDSLRTGGRIDSAVSREGAFLANNVVFAVFAFVVLLGTVFPLLAEAINGERITVGRPYFDRMTMPVGMVLLFLMAVAPVLPWRTTSSDILRTRLFWPSVAATTALVLSVAFDVRGFAPLLAFGLGAFAAAGALRQLVLSVRRQGLGAIVGRSNGGMVVHIGVVIIAVAFAASSSFSHRAEFRLSRGESAVLAGHKVTYLGNEQVTYDNRTAIEASVRVDDGQVYKPALTRFPFATQSIGTPSVRTGLANDVYLTLVAQPNANGEAVIGVFVQPLVSWLWLGGGVIILGTLLAAIPPRRKTLLLDSAPLPITDLESLPEPVHS